VLGGTILVMHELVISPIVIKRLTGQCSSTKPNRLGLKYGNPIRTEVRCAGIFRIQNTAKYPIRGGCSADRLPKKLTCFIQYLIPSTVLQSEWAIPIHAP
jgi:hypothetical protein